jgi:hypothetical protein
METIGTHCQGNIQMIVHYEQHTLLSTQVSQLPSHDQKLCLAPLLVAQLDRPDATANGCGSYFHFITPLQSRRIENKIQALQSTSFVMPQEPAHQLLLQIIDLEAGAFEAARFASQWTTRQAAELFQHAQRLLHSPRVGHYQGWKILMLQSHAFCCRGPHILRHPTGREKLMFQRAKVLD